MKNACKISYMTSYRNHFGSLGHLNARADLSGLLRKLTLRRAWNILNVFCDWKRGMSRVRSRPFVFSLEAATTCNLRCPRCTPPGQDRRQRQTALMSLKTFSRVVSALEPYGYIMKFHLNGEPMMNPRLFDMVRLASDHKIYTSFSTNFNLMKPELLEPLFASGLSWLSVCLDGYSQEAYEKYRIRGNVDAVKDGIQMVMEHKRRHRFKHPFVNVFAITFNHVKPEIPQIISFCSENGVDRLAFRPDQFNFDGSHKVEYGLKPYRKCFYPWMWPVIDVDGSVYPCPAAFYNGFKKPFGNLTEQGLDAIWNNEAFTECRRFLSGRPKDESTVDLPCHECKGFGDLRRRPLPVPAATT